ncbi:MAG TPA: class I SAM-dependent methyltransferase [Tepidisphaeraceae bacterium]|nr:class I SAM-dependent methyltransferase [Tepidisphaeraceae bacterium]
MSNDSVETSVKCIRRPLDERLFVEPFEAVPRARGYVEQVCPTSEGLRVSGWMLIPEAPFTRIDIYLDGVKVAQAQPHPTDGVRRAFKWIPHATNAGFHVILPQFKPGAQHEGRVDMLGFVGDYATGTLGTWFSTDLDARIPAPSPELIERVAAHKNQHFFRVTGLKNFGEFLSAVRRHRPVSSVRRVLDWGCGCGRLASHFLTLPQVEVDGCDIDGEAVGWCKENLPEGRFVKSDLWPPLPYDDGTFDLIIAFSVFSHLDRNAQAKWLAELKRVLAPGGLLLASVHGPFAARFSFQDDYFKRLANGIFDIDDTRLDGIAPDQYYRGTFQTPSYTRSEWGRHLDVIDYIERGISNHHDMVVLRRSR